MDIVEKLRDIDAVGRIEDCGHSTRVCADAADEIECLRKVAKAARCIHHWHDSDNDGMVVSGEHVRALWQALHDLDETPNV